VLGIAAVMVWMEKITGLKGVKAVEACFFILIGWLFSMFFMSSGTYVLLAWPRWSSFPIGLSIMGIGVLLLYSVWWLIERVRGSLEFESLVTPDSPNPEFKSDSIVSGGSPIP